MLTYQTTKSIPSSCLQQTLSPGCCSATTTCSWVTVDPLPSCPMQATYTMTVVGARRLAREICSKCVICRAAAAEASTQLIGQLPPERVEPNYVFYHTGMDFAGPFIIRKGHTRKPVEIKAFLAVFICFCTKAVHLELVSDMTTEAFIAALDRFISRRGLPLHLHSDNGSNFLGAKNELAEYYKLMNSKETQNAVHSYVFDHEVTWHTIPERAPHFVGLREAAVKAAKYHLKRIVGQYKFTFEELYTIICCSVESYLNSRPLGPITSHKMDGVSPLTPSHFLIGRAARASPGKRFRSLLHHNRDGCSASKLLSTSGTGGPGSTCSSYNMQSSGIRKQGIIK